MKFKLAMSRSEQRAYRAFLVILGLLVVLAWGDSQSHHGQFVDSRVYRQDLHQLQVKIGELEQGWRQHADRLVVLQQLLNVSKKPEPPERQKWVTPRWGAK